MDALKKLTGQDPKSRRRGSKKAPPARRYAQEEKGTLPGGDSPREAAQGSEGRAQEMAD